VNKKRQRVHFVQNDRSETAGLSFSRSRYPLFYDASSELSVYQSAFGVFHGLAQCVVIKGCFSGKARKGLISEYPHSVVYAAARARQRDI
jgi:hypothetical protein